MQSVITYFHHATSRKEALLFIKRHYIYLQILQITGTQYAAYASSPAAPCQGYWGDPIDRNQCTNTQGVSP